MKRTATLNGEFNANQLEEILEILQQQDTTDRHIDTTIIEYGMYGMYEIDADFIGNIEVRLTKEY